MFSRATSMPASTRRRMWSAVSTAGPSVHTILALRTTLNLAPGSSRPSRREIAPASGRRPRTDDPANDSDEEWPLRRTDRAGQGGVAGEVPVHGRGRGAALRDRPDDQRLA